MSEAAVAGIAPRIPAPASEAALPRALRVKVMAGAVAYDTLRAEWRRLAERQPGSLVFQTPEILTSWSRHFSSRNALATVVVREGDRAILIWPLMIERRMPVSIARGAGAPITQYEDLLLDPDADAPTALRAALHGLRKALGPDLLLLERVRGDSRLYAALAGSEPLSSAEAAPYTDLSGGIETAFAALKPTVAKKQRKRIRRFYREGTVSFALADDPAEAEAWLVAALQLKREWLKSTGRISRAFLRDCTEDCLVELARTLTKGETAPKMVVSKLGLDGRPAAFEAGFCYRGDYFVYLRTFAPQFAVLGPGNVLTEHMLRWCAMNGITRCDMLAPRSRNKSEWQSGEVPVFDFALPMSGVGRLYKEAVLKRIGPALRTSFYALPLPLRAAMIGAALKRGPAAARGTPRD